MIEPVFNAWRARRTGPETAARVHHLREIVNTILYVNRTGIPWEYVPHDFPPYKTVYDYYAKWEADGTTQQVHDLLRDKTRRFHGRRAEPTAAVVDSQSLRRGRQGGRRGGLRCGGPCQPEAGVRAVRPRDRGGAVVGSARRRFRRRGQRGRRWPP
ncbi:transposase [Streptomyces canus]